MQATREAIDGIFRAESGAIVATLIRVLRDFDLAQDVVQDAFAAAIRTWPDKGMPQKPGAWLTTAARNRAIDLIRQRTRSADRQVALEQLAELSAGGAGCGFDDADEPAPLRDDQLRLIFTCCHPALTVGAQVALTLHTIGGLSTEEIARAFLVPTATLAQRLVRAKRKIREANIPYRVPPQHLLAERLNAVLTVVYLIFNEGYSASGGDAAVRASLCQDALRIGRVLAATMGDSPEVSGLLALMMLHDARRGTRTDEDGRAVLLRKQDRSRWDHAQIADGAALLQNTLRKGRAGPYQIQAAIAALHAEAARADDTDWPQIAALYGLLERMHPSPVVRLNRAVAIAMVDGPERGLELLDVLAGEGQLATYHLFHSARADLLRTAGRFAEAAAAYRMAFDLARNRSDRDFLRERLYEVEDAGA